MHVLVIVIVLTLPAETVLMTSLKLSHILTAMHSSFGSSPRDPFTSTATSMQSESIHFRFHF
uniref:Uncharacterized protein n=1 Tax=Rhizophora mucronata TaxID=61149 RepID=A0A2P2P403_RHIMU